MEKISNELFPKICFLVLMNHQDTAIEKHFLYIYEKLYMLKSVMGAYTALDRNNQLKVLRYFNQFDLELPKEVIEYEEDMLRFVTNLSDLLL